MKAETNGEFAINMQLWARAPGWSIEDMCWLALDYDPLKVRRAKAVPELSAKQQDLVRDVQGALDVFYDGTEQSRRPAPHKALELLSLAGIEMPAQLVQAVSGLQQVEPPAERSKAAGTKELNSLKKILLAVAVEKFDHSPDRGAAGRISSAARSRGIAIDEATVRKFLTQALNELDQGEKDELFRRRS